MSYECIPCRKPLPDNGPVAIYSECSYSYHFGTCSDIFEATFKKKGESARIEWKCPTCQKGKQRSQSFRETKPSEADITGMFASISQKHEILTNLKETVDGIEHSVQIMSDQYDEVMSQLTAQNADIKNLKARVTKLEENDSQNQVSQLKDELNELEWRSRRQNFEFHGIPLTNIEDLLEKINDVVAKIGVPDLIEQEIVSVHRLILKPGKVPAVIVRFTQQQTRDLWPDKKN